MSGFNKSGFSKSGLIFVLAAIVYFVATDSITDDFVPPSALAELPATGIATAKTPIAKAATTPITVRLIENISSYPRLCYVIYLCFQ
jgi:hypothetical protein